MTIERPKNETYLGYIEGAPKHRRSLEELYYGKTVNYPKQVLENRLERLITHRMAGDFNDMGLKFLDNAIVSTIAELRGIGVYNPKALERIAKKDK